MNPVQNPTEQAHGSLVNILLNGRILINGLPLTGNELGMVVQQEQMLFGKASQLDKDRALATEKKKTPQDPKPNVVPFKKSQKK